jgi:hypothetical protein
LEEAEKKGIRLRIWNKKELENYLLVPSAISRLLGKLGRGRKNHPDESATRSKLEEIAENLKDTVIGGIADEIPRATGMSASAAYNLARTRVAETWDTFDGKMALISGKEALTALNRWCQDNFKISFTAVRLASELRLNEIDCEVRDFLSAIEFNEAF